ncbi:unnamed protein product, partial [Prorocentrum cordatum]
APEEARREAIATRLSQSQRLALERWMLARRRPPAAAAALGPPEVPAGPEGAGSRGRGYHPVIHLGRGLYAQAGGAGAGAAAIGLLAARSRLKHCGPEEFEGRVRAAVAGVAGCRAQGAAAGLLFRTRVSFGREVRLTSPLRHDVAAALRDWRGLREA